MSLIATIYDIVTSQYNVEEIAKIEKVSLVNGFNVLRVMRLIKMALITIHLVQPVMVEGGKIFVEVDDTETPSVSESKDGNEAANQEGLSNKNCKEDKDEGDVTPLDQGAD